ncbi:hypothetical protein HPB47_022198 [Ixodes persulcatus]|uniref:Uncharacterized protein n=1 Tax=Ixodes persulcatus TaxID=34615 RepID=A0AC60QAC0_IXOPE|nr:hypothetical protein HPB47_022198 [Ixodes persulcatus]
MASFVKWICLAASVSVATGFDFGSLDPKAMIDKIRDTLEMAVGMLWITGASMKCSKTLKRLVKDVFAGEMWALYVIDAMAKPEPGILEGGFNSIGSQSECLKAWAQLNITGRDRNQSMWRVDDVQENLLLLKDKMKDLTIQFMINFTPAADTIICLFGFMMSYVTMKTLRDQKAVQTRGFFLRHLVHRIARLAPLMVLATLLVVPLFPQSGQGPTWELEVNKFLSGCSRNWWWNVLHINNFLGRKEQA